MKHIKGIIAILLLSALLVTGCGASKSNYGSTVAATYGDKTIYLDEANFWLRMAEQSYGYWASMYIQMYGGDFWSAPSERRTQTYAESVREDVMAELRQIYILLDHASEYDTNLSEEDLKKIDDTIAELKTYYGDTIFTESVIGSFSDEALKQSLITRSQALKVWHGVREQATTTVTDDESRSFTLRYFRMNDSASVKDGEETVKGQAIAQLLENQLLEGKTFDELSSTYNTLYFAKESFRINDTENTAQLYLVGKDMKDGQVRQFTDNSGTSPIYYVVECVSADDSDAAAAAREQLESVQKEEYFTSVFTEWQKSAKEFSVKSAYLTLPLPNQP